MKRVINYSLITLLLAVVYDIPASQEKDAFTSDLHQCVEVYAPGRCRGIEVIVVKKCEDSTGKFFIVACRNISGKLGEPGFKTELFVEKVRDGRGGMVDWKIYDYSSEPLTSVVFYKNSVSAFDFNSDGVLETSFFYAISPDGLEPDSLKMMVHYGNQKYAIRGVIPRVSEYRGDYKRSLDKKFNDAPIDLRVYAEEQWDSFVSENFDAFKE